MLTVLVTPTSGGCEDSQRQCWPHCSVKLTVVLFVLLFKNISEVQLAPPHLSFFGQHECFVAAPTPLLVFFHQHSCGGVRASTSTRAWPFFIPETGAPSVLCRQRSDQHNGRFCFFPFNPNSRHAFSDYCTFIIVAHSSHFAYCRGSLSTKYYLSGLLTAAGCPYWVLVASLAVIAERVFNLFDATRVGMFVSLATATLGPLIEVRLVHRWAMNINFKWQEQQDAVVFVKSWSRASPTSLMQREVYGGNLVEFSTIIPWL